MLKTILAGYITGVLLPLAPLVAHAQSSSCPLADDGVVSLAIGIAGARDW